MRFYVSDKAKEIVELFEDVLDKYNIYIPSEEDDQREPNNEAKLYGMVYWELIEEVEKCLTSPWEYIIDGLRNKNEKERFWADTDNQICTVDEGYANAVADFLEDIGFDTVHTSYDEDNDIWEIY